MDLHYASSSGSDFSWPAAVFSFIVVVGIFAAVCVAVYLIEKRAQKRHANEWIEANQGALTNALREADGLARQLRSPLSPPDVVQQWHDIRQEFETEPNTRDVAEAVVTAHRNMSYLWAIEAGDPRRRTQVVNELMSEAKVFRDDRAAYALRELRGRVGDPNFCGELARVVQLLGESSRWWNGANLEAMDQSETRRKNYTESVSPTIGQREYRPGAGLNGFTPVDAMWRNYSEHLNVYPTTRAMGLKSNSTARFYRRWKKGELIR